MSPDEREFIALVAREVAGLVAAVELGEREGVILRVNRFLALLVDHANAPLIRDEALVAAVAKLEAQ